MRLDATDLRYVTPDEFRVLAAVEIGSKNHEVVPTSLIAEISAVRGGNVNKALGALAKRDLVARVQNAKYDGYRLTYGGLDYLALRTFSRRKPPSVYSVGKKIGVGKESDIYVVKDEEKDSRVLKLHRLGRISFRAIKSKRDYLGKRKSASWMYMSRLAAQKEFAFMKVLYQHGFPTPVPIDQARHCIVMSLIDSYPLRQIDKVPDPADLYSKLMTLILDFAYAGLIHGDFNEFNILIKRKDGEPVVIDFPQMVSTRHENAEYFFNRDVNCIRRFFKRRFGFEGTVWPTWKDVVEGEEAEAAAEDKEADPEVQPESEEVTPARKGKEVDNGEAAGRSKPARVKQETDRIGESSTSAVVQDLRGQRLRLDLEVEASGFGRALQRELEDYMIEVQDMPQSEPEYEDDDIQEEEDASEDEVEGGQDAHPEPKETVPPTAAKPFNDDEFQAQVAGRLEKLRLDKALGNDEDYVSPPSADEGGGNDSDSDSSSLLSDGPPQSDFTAYTRTRVHSARPTAKKLDTNPLSLKNVVARQVEREMEDKEKRTGSSKGRMGKAKGHKWKANPNYLVGGKGDGWA